MRQGRSRHQFFLSSLPPTVREQRFALGLVWVSVAIFLLSVPFAKLPLTPLPVFIASYQSILIVSDVVTAVLLFGNASILQSRALVWLAGGYLFTGTIAAMHMLTFPGLFTSGGLLGAGPQSTAWLYMFWHAGFPLAVMAYLQMQDKETRQLPRHFIISSVLIVIGLVAGMVILTMENAALLPLIMSGHHYTGIMIFVVGSVWGLIFATFIRAWRHRTRSVLDLWLMVSMFTWLIDVALSAVLNGGRFDLGFYLGRLSGLLSSSVVLLVLLSHTMKLYSDLVLSTEELERSNEEIDSFAFAVSHDLRAPLRAMKGFSQALLEDLGDTLHQEARSYLDEIVTASRKMGALIDGILSLSRLTRGEVRNESVDVSALSTSLLEGLSRSEPQRQVSWSVEPNLKAFGDPSMLEAAFSNLIENAWKYSAKTAQAEIRIYSQDRGDRQWICISDNGAGFDMQCSAQLFKPFQRLHRQDEFEGHGIGLATVQRILRRHGGDIEAMGEPGKGATFSLTLPESSVTA